MNKGETTGDSSSMVGAGGPRRLVAALRLPGRWTAWLLLVVAGLSALSLATQVFRYSLGLQFPGLNSLERWFFVDREMGVPAWFSASLLLLAGERLWQVGTATRALGGRWAGRWQFLGAAFVYLSLDELTEIHEQLIRPVKGLLHLGGALSFAWVVIALPVLAVFGLLFLRFLTALPRWTRWAFVLSAICYVGGAVGLEMVGAVLADRTGVVQTVVTTVDGIRTESQVLNIPTVTYAVVVGLEEALEMVGAVLFLGAVTGALTQARQRGGLSARPGEPEADPPPVPARPATESSS